MSTIPDESPASIASLGGKARAAKLTPEQRSEIASKAAQARWSIREDVKTEPGDYPMWVIYRPNRKRRGQQHTLSMLAAFFHPVLAKEWCDAAPHRAKDKIVKETIRIL